MVIFGVSTLTTMYGLWRGARWPCPVIYATRILDMVSSLLGPGDRPSVALVVIGAVTLVLSVAVIVALARNPAAELTLLRIRVRARPRALAPLKTESGRVSVIRSWSYGVRPCSLDLRDMPEAS
jgi:hypothetical protein